MDGGLGGRAREREREVGRMARERERRGRTLSIYRGGEEGTYFMTLF